MKKHPLTNCLLSLAFVSLLFSCGSRRTLQHTAVDVTSRHVEAAADTVSSVSSQYRTVTDTSSTATSSVTLERDTFLLQWDTVGNRAVLTSAVRIHMLSQLMASEATVKTLDDVFSQGTTVRHVNHVNTDSLTAIEDNMTEDVPQPTVRSPTTLNCIIIGFIIILFLLCGFTIYAYIARPLFEYNEHNDDE